MLPDGAARRRAAVQGPDDATTHGAGEATAVGYDVVRLVEERAVLRVTGYLAATLLGIGATAAAYLLARG
jgi:2-methylcitrate dehydratase PrpD